MDGPIPSAADGDSIEGLKGRECKNGSQVSSEHRRSKSASDRNWDVIQRGISHSLGKHQNVAKLRDLMKENDGEYPVQQISTIGHNEALSDHRTSLETDIKQLQMRLQEERAMRVMLERAIGRTSSTLSPGHRHFAAQTKELIEEIELLEEEVANREQHVLTLYRNIFEHCVSRPPSQQNSVVASPVHMKKNEVRRHPSIISTAFCSSKKFPLEPFQVLSPGKDTVKRKTSLHSRARRASLLGTKTRVEINSNSSDPIKIHGKEPTEKNSLSWTLKDHLHQCPSMLSQELVRCMAATYWWVRGAASPKPEKGLTPFLSRCSINAIQSPRDTGHNHDYSDGSLIEISSISTDRNHCSRASYAISNYRILVEHLERVNAAQMEDDAKMAFWINVYNSLVMHAFLAYGIPGNTLRRMALFHKAAYNIGGHIVSANCIEQVLLCCHTTRIGRWYETILSTAMRKKSGEEKKLMSSGFGLSRSQPLVCFALCRGATSDPVLKVYRSTDIKEQLEAAKKDYLQTNVLVKKSRKVLLPRLLESFSKEACISSENLLSWVAENVDGKLCEVVKNCIDSKSKRKSSHFMEWLPYDTRFRYTIARDLTEKPW